MNQSVGAVWIAFLAAALLAQIVVTVVRTRHDGAVPFWSVAALIGIALLLAVRVRQWQRGRSERR